MARSYMNVDIDAHALKTSQARDTMTSKELEKISFSSFLRSFEKIIIKSLPSIIVMELSIFSSVANMYFVHGNRDVIGVGFGTMWLDITTNAVLINANIAIASIMNKHFRDKKPFKVGICYQRGLLLGGIYLILITPVLGQSHQFFKLIGIEGSIYEPAVYYGWESIPGAWSFAYFDTTKNYLQAMNIYYPVIVIQLFTAIFHYSICKSFIVDFGLGMRGAAWAKNTSDTLSALLVYFYILKYHSHNPSWVEWDKATLKSLGNFTKSLFNLGFKYYIQACSFEIMCFFAAHLGFSQMTVSVCLSFTAQAMFMVFSGISQVIQTTINEHFKANDIKGARQRSFYFLISTLFIGVLMSLMLNIFKTNWLGVFGLREDDEQKMLSMLWIFSITMIIDGLQISMASILNSIGFMSFTLNVQLFAQYGIGICTGVYLTYYRKQGIEGLWIGWAIGLSCSVIALFIKLGLTDWQKAAKELLVVVPAKVEKTEKQQTAN